MQILKMTEPTTSNSVFLDVGCGCGYKVDQLQKAGFQAYGLENSAAMIERAKSMHPDILVTEGDVLNPILFDKSTFSHVLCTNFTIYEMENKMDFFRNCHGWMTPNAYLILHLVDPEKFNAVVPVTKNEWRRQGKTQKHARLTDTLVDFYDFKYQAHYEFPADMKKDCLVEFTQTFTDRGSGKVRKNEQILYMESISDILKMANEAGFVFHGKAVMTECNKDENQYLFILERIM
jgi:SAM-dependent methyltransferase